MLELWLAVGLSVPFLADSFELSPGQVELTRAHFHGLAIDPEKPSACAWARRRELDLVVEPEGIRVHGRWTLVAEGGSLFVGDLLVEQAHVLRATWNGRSAALWNGDRGPVIVGRVERTATVEVDAYLPSPGTPARLEVLEAVTGTVAIHSPSPLRVEATDGSVVLPNPDGSFVTGARSLRLAPPVAAAETGGPVALATAGIGLTVEDDVLVTRARVVFTLRRGSLPRFTLRTTGFGEDLDVEGPNVASWTRSGNDLAIELQAPIDSTTSVELRATTPIPNGAESRLPLPHLGSAEAFRFESTLALARTGELDAVPTVADGTTIAAEELPEWGQGLVTGTPTAAYRLGNGAETGTLSCLRFLPAPGPPVRVEVADLLYVTAAGGETLLRARYEVTNERATALEVRPPVGARPVGAWVAGKQAPLAAVGTRLRIPLKRSVETPDGLLTFPVVLVLLGPGQRWSRREARDLMLPVVDAPVGVADITVRLPRRYRSLLDPGEQGVVERFSRADDTAYHLDSKENAETLVALADTLYADAIDAWNNNEFDRAEQRLKELDAIGASSANQRGLESNLALVRPPSSPASLKSPEDHSGEKLAPPAKAGSVALAPAPASADSRRIRAQARARGAKHKTEQRAAKQRARELRDEGKYDEAAAEYARAIEATESLQQLDDAETTTHYYYAAELEAELEAVEDAKVQRQELEASSKMKLWSGGPFAGGRGPSPPKASPPPLAGLAPVFLPSAGEEVRYELTLLEPGAARSVHIAARRRRGSR
ncbi:MAG: hypothetical protein JW751_03680 [Polyangiaceae bacterium]|nr:hypothetical protein [Polyangiaceae bacterium]